MRTIYNPPRHEWPAIIERPPLDSKELFKEVAVILEDIRTGGDRAVASYSERFDGYKSDNPRVTETELSSAGDKLPNDLKEAIKVAARNIETFHSSQLQPVKKIETQPGVTCWQKSVPIDKVGIYVPGGTAPLFSTALMLGIPARIAGCPEIVMCTPPDKLGQINPAILYAATIAGITQVYKIGGVQAIGAMAYGTSTVPMVYKIFGPGNRHVTAAKQLVAVEGTAIDMPAGPSEVLVIADESANPVFVAADLLSQAEHGPGSQVILLTTCSKILAQTLAQVELQLKSLPRATFAEGALKASRAILLNSLDEMMEMSNLYAPEHLILSVTNPMEAAGKVVNAGSVFLGNYTPESAGDYASGTNHTLPTNGYARAFSGVNLDSYSRKITFQEVTLEGLKKLGPVVEKMALAEELQAHANAVTVRLKESGSTYSS